jgi:TonB family protein
MRRRTLLLTALLCQIPLGINGRAGQAPMPVAARLRAGAAAPLAPQMTTGGGEVVLDLTVGKDGAVANVEAIRSTPPYTALLLTAVGGWAFDSAKAVVEDALQPAAGHVVVAAVYRPPQVYAAPARGAEPKTTGELSPELPVPGGLSAPAAYPPRATGDGAVIVELELSAAGAVRGTKVMSRPSPFDGAALAAVNGWRFGPPSEPSGAEPIFAYAIVGFRQPITP